MIKKSKLGRSALMLFSGLLISLTTIVACRKNVLDPAQVTQLTENSEKSLRGNVQPNTNPEPEEYILALSADCEFINNVHPDSTYKIPDCYNKKPDWWPNLNQRVFYPDWVWQHEGGYNPLDHKRLLIQLPPNKIFSLPRSNQDDLYDLLEAKIQRGFGVIRNKYDLLTVADFGLSPDEVLFLDNYFAEKILLMDGLRAGFPNNSVVSLEDISILELYMQFKTRPIFFPANLNNFPVNFFGENNDGHMSQFFYTQYSNRPFHLVWNVRQSWSYRTTVVNSIIENPKLPGEKFYVILPKYYFYLMVDPAAIRADYLFSEQPLVEAQ